LRYLDSETQKLIDMLRPENRDRIVFDETRRRWS